MLSIATLAVFAAIYGDLPDAKHAWAVHDWNRPKPTKVEPGAYAKAGAPSDAVVLFDGTKESFDAHWCDSKGGPSKWKLGTEGDFYCEPGWVNGGAIRTRDEFGDCQLHLEYRHEPDITDGGKGPQMRGNSGVFLMSNYEVQVLESYYTSLEMTGKPGFVDNYADGQAGAVYAENPPLVNPARKPGEWQTYDIVFHQPVWDGDRLLHPGSVTVFFNGVLVQDHWEMEGLTTHKSRRPLAPHPLKAPLELQDHGCTVHFRNIWYRPLQSRWDNRTCSKMSAKYDDVMALRHKIAAELFAKIKKPIEPTVANMQAVGEVIGYVREGEYDAAWKDIVPAFCAKLDAASDEELAAMKSDLLKLRESLDTLIKAGLEPKASGTRKRICAIAKRLGWEK